MAENPFLMPENPFLMDFLPKAASVYVAVWLQRGAGMNTNQNEKTVQDVSLA